MVLPLLSVEFTLGFMLVIGVMMLFGVLKIRSGTQNFARLVAEFSRWDPRTHNPDSLNSYHFSVLQVSSAPASTACSAWAQFIESVELEPQGDQHVGLCDAGALSRLREDLVAAYQSAYKVTRLNGSLLSGAGFAGMLLIAFAASIATKDQLQTGQSGALQASLGLYLHSGGLAFVCALAGLVCSMLFRAFERAQASQTEQLIDLLINDLRLRVSVKNSQGHLAQMSRQLEQMTERFTQVASGWVERLAAANRPAPAPAPAPAPQLDGRLADALAKVEAATREAADTTAQALAAKLESASHQVISRLEDGIKHSESQTRSLTEVLEQMIDLGTSQTRVWETSLHEQRQHSQTLQQQSSSLAGLEQSQGELAAALRDWADNLRQTAPGPVPPPVDLAPVLGAIGQVKEAIENLDEGIEDDVDDIIASTKEAQIAVHQLIHDRGDRVESQLSSVATQLESLIKTIPQRLETMPQTTVALAVDDKALYRGIEGAIERGLRSWSENVTLPAQHSSPQTKAKSVRSPRTQPAKPGPTLPAAAPRAKSLRPQLGLIVADVAATRRALLEGQHIASVEGTRGPSGGGSSINSSISVLEGIIAALQEQTAARRGRYGKAYEPLAQGNALAEQILREACNTLGGVTDGDVSSGHMDHDENTPIQMTARLARIETALIVMSGGRSAVAASAQEKEQMAGLAALSGLWRRARQEAEAWASQASPEPKKHHRGDRNDPDEALVRDFARQADELAALVHAGITEQLTRWPEILDRSRRCLDDAKVIGASSLRRVAKAPRRRLPMPRVIAEAVAQSEDILQNQLVPEPPYPTSGHEYSNTRSRSGRRSKS